MLRGTLRDYSQTRIEDTKTNFLMRNRVRCHVLLVSSCTTVLFFLSSFFDMSSTTFEISPFLCSSVWRLTSVVLDLLFKIEKFLCKMAISLKNCRVEQKNYSLLANWSDWGLSLQDLLRLAVDLSIQLTLGSTASCVRPSASLEFLHSLIPPHYHYCISLRSVQDTTPRRRSLLMLVLSLSLTLTPPQYAHGRVRVRRNLDPAFYNYPVFVEFLWCVVTCLSILSVPLLAP